MKIGALVPARIGSKRLPKKNITPLGGKPLLCWTLDVLMEAGFFSDVTVSTESSEVCDVVRTYYSEKEVSILHRPSDMAQDDSPLSEVIRHYLNNKDGLLWYGIFLPTFPFRSVERFHEIFTGLISNYPWQVSSASIGLFSTLDFFYPCEEGVRRFFRMPPVYCSFSTPVYNLSNVRYPQHLWNHYGLTALERTYLSYVTKMESLDIDYPEDFKIAEEIANGKRFKRIPLKREEYRGWTIVLPENVSLDKIIRIVGEERMRDKSQPLLVLEPGRVPLTFLRLFDGHARNYWAGREALNYFDNQKVKSTQNMQYSPLYYRHSEIYRFLREYDHLEINNKFGISDDCGIMYKAGTETASSFITKDRVVMIEELQKECLPIESCVIG